jgi:hypothetical protein
MADLTENLGRMGLTLGEALADTDDLDSLVRAVARERAIRATMAETGETHEIVASVLDAAISMDQEAVLDLMDGEPTTLARGLARYVAGLESLPEGYNLTVTEVVDNLGSLLAYPWPQR